MSTTNRKNTIRELNPVLRDDKPATATNTSRLYDAVQSGRSGMTFRRILLHLSRAGLLHYTAARPRKQEFSVTYVRNSRADTTVQPRTGHESPEGEYTYSYTLSLTSELDGVGWSTSRSGRFTPPPPEKTRYPLYRRQGGPKGRSGRVRSISSPTGFHRRTVHPIEVDSTSRL